MSDNAIRRIQVGDLRKMSDREGLILQGCGGDPQEWLTSGLLTALCASSSGLFIAPNLQIGRAHV